MPFCCHAYTGGQTNRRKSRAGQAFGGEKYTYREFVTSMTGKAHKVIEEYDKRADSENLIGEAKREGLAAIVSNKFMTNYAYFQIVMLSYNIWRSFKMLAGHSQLLEQQQQQAEGSKVEPQCAARSDRQYDTDSPFKAVVHSGQDYWSFEYL